MATKKTQKHAENNTDFYCEICDFITCKKNDLLRHNLTQKHIRNSLATSSNKATEKTTEKTLICEFCDKIYKDRTGLWRHNKKCKVIKTNYEHNVNNNNKSHDNDAASATEDDITNELNEPTDKELFMMVIKQNIELIKGNSEPKPTDDGELINYLIKENQEFKNLILEIVKKDTYQNNNNTTNSHNKAFNLQFFLNETCKDAMNITDFVESIKLQLSDTENVGKVGYVEGISSIIVRSLKELDVSQRPVHCTDQKRETMYIKDDDKWERDEDQKKMHKIVRKVTDKNARMVMQFKEVHPDCMTSSSRYSDQYRKIIMEAMCGRGDNTFEKEEKIIKKISKAVLVNKDNT